MAVKKKYKYGLALSGGGARGFAHLGVLQAFNEAGIFPEVISGTSSGAIAAAMYCDGKAPKEILEIVAKNDLNGKINLLMLMKGLMKHDNLKKVLQAQLKNKHFEDLRIPLFVNATDFYKGEEKVFSSGTLTDKIIASSSVPLIYEPTYIDGIPYVDGGLTNNLCVAPVRPLCEILIGVNVNPVKPWKDKSSLTDNLDRSLYMALRPNILKQKESCDIYIEPEELSKYYLFDSKKIHEIFKVGYEHTKTLLKKGRLLG
ncbi:MAG: patatin-like phospholipase family protein [Bacteroidia bacterium]|nr:patatin-like phospholipase family protein [Bacteroidia bacterium]